MNSLVIGAGEVGQAIYEIVRSFHKTSLRDKVFSGNGIKDYQVLHICYPDHPGFIQTTTDYIKEYKPDLTVIHSSVMIGTTDACGEGVVYSPVRGRHPNLTPEIKIYEKFIAGRDFDKLLMASKYFLDCGLKVVAESDPKSLELVKLLSNIHMGVEIAWRQEVDRMLKYWKIDHQVYDRWEDTYNKGYKVLGQERLMRPRMNAHPIGGHCILECTEILSRQFPSKVFDFVLESNEAKKQEIKR